MQTTANQKLTEKEVVLYKKEGAYTKINERKSK